MAAILRGICFGISLKFVSIGLISKVPFSTIIFHREARIALHWSAITLKIADCVIAADGDIFTFDANKNTAIGMCRAGDCQRCRKCSSSQQKSTDGHYYVLLRGKNQVVRDYQAEMRWMGSSGVLTSPNQTGGLAKLLSNTAQQPRTSGVRRLGRIGDR